MFGFGKKKEAPPPPAANPQFALPTEEPEVDYDKLMKDVTSIMGTDFDSQLPDLNEDDLNDPDLEAELRECGWQSDDDDKAAPAASQQAPAAPAPGIPPRQQPTRQPQKQQEQDLEIELSEEEEEHPGPSNPPQVSQLEPTPTKSRSWLSRGSSTKEEPEPEPQPEPEPTKPSWTDNPAAEVARLKQEAVQLSQEGNKQHAVQLLRRAKALQAMIDRNASSGPNPAQQQQQQQQPVAQPAPAPPSSQKSSGGAALPTTKQQTKPQSDEPFTHPSHDQAAQRILDFKRVAVLHKRAGNVSEAMAALNQARGLETALVDAKQNHLPIAVPAAPIDPTPPAQSAAPAKRVPETKSGAAIKSIASIASRLGDNELEVIVHGCTHLDGPKGGLDTYVTFEWDEQNYTSKTAKDTLNPQYSFVNLLKFDRHSRSVQKKFQKKKVIFEVYYKRGLFRNDEVFVRSTLLLSPLLEDSFLDLELETFSPERPRHPTGAKLHVSVRLASPIGGGNEDNRKSLPANTAAPASSPRTAAPPKHTTSSPATKQPQQHIQQQQQTPPAAKQQQHAAGTPPAKAPPQQHHNQQQQHQQPKAAAGAPTNNADDEEIQGYWDALESINMMVSFDVLTWEEEEIEKLIPKLPEVMAEEASNRILEVQTRKTILQTQVAMGRLTIEEYLELAKKQMAYEKDLAVKANQMGTARGKEIAKRALTRYKIVKKEIETAEAQPDEEE